MANYLNETGLVTLWGCILDYLDEQGYVLDSDSRLTDAHINSLIDAKLGVIENGTY